jgi:hypothetical protein
MDSHTKKRLVWSLFSNVVSRLAQTAMYVLPASLRIAHDTFPAFMVGMLHYPHSLKPGELWAQIRRSKPGLEAE